MQHIKKYELYLLMTAAFLFSLAVRYIWVAMNIDNPQFMWNDQLMINTNDGYFFAEGARDILAGGHQELDGSPVDNFSSQLTALFAFMVPFSFESVILYMPSLLSSLVVVPMVLIGNALGMRYVGFIAALVGSIAWSYYNRTMVGYYDTDMLNIVLPTVLLWTLIRAFQTREDRFLLFMALDIIAYRLWYPQSYSLEFGFFALVLAFVLMYERKNVYMIKLLAMMLLAMMGLDTMIRAVLVVALYVFYKRLDVARFAYGVLGVALVLFFVTGGLDPIWGQLKGYVFKDATDVIEGEINLQFFSVMQTISEAGAIPFEMFANRISGNGVLFLVSIAGYVWLSFKHRVMLLALPMVGLGFLAYGIPGLIGGGGLRFTIYAVVPMALGIAYLFFEVSKLLSMQASRYQVRIHLALASLFTALALYPHIAHVVEYQVPTVMSAQEVAQLDKLQKIASREDYVVAWWDYGYPIRYYSDTKTLGDGGAHSGEVNFPLSVALTKPQELSAKIARLRVEDREKNEKNASLMHEPYSLWTRLFKEAKLASTQDVFEHILLDTNFSLPAKTREIYYYLPYKMTSIYTVVESFSAMNIATGEKETPSFFRAFPLRKNGDRFDLASGVYFSLRDGKLYQNNKPVDIKMLYNASYTQEGALNVQKQLLSMRGDLNMILLPSYGQVLLLDDAALHSTYVQLFFLEQADSRYFEPAILSPYAKIYKLKI